MLVLNAAMLGTLTPVNQIDGKEFGQVLTLNLLAQQALIAAFDPLLRKSEAGRLIAITSGVAQRPRPLRQKLCQGVEVDAAIRSHGDVDDLIAREPAAGPHRGMLDRRDQKFFTRLLFVCGLDRRRQRQPGEFQVLPAKGRAVLESQCP